MEDLHPPFQGDLVLKLHQPNTQSPGQLPTFLLYSLFSFFWCVHISFTQKKRDLFSTLPFRRSGKSNIKSKMNNIETQWGVLSLSKISRWSPLFPFRFSIICLFPWTPQFPLAFANSQILQLLQRLVFFSLCSGLWGFPDYRRKQMLSGWRVFVSSNAQRIPKRV